MPYLMRDWLSTPESICMSRCRKVFQISKQSRMTWESCDSDQTRVHREERLGTKRLEQGGFRVRVWRTREARMRNESCLSTCHPARQTTQDAGDQTSSQVPYVHSRANDAARRSIQVGTHFLPLHLHLPEPLSANSHNNKSDLARLIRRESDIE